MVSDQFLQVAHVLLERGGVTTGVGEKPSLPLHDAPVAGHFEAASPAGADPAPVEEVLLLPPEHGPGGVRLGGEGAAAAEGFQRRCEKLAGYGRHVDLPSVSVPGSGGWLLLLECLNCTRKQCGVGEGA